LRQIGCATLPAISCATGWSGDTSHGHPGRVDLRDRATCMNGTAVVWGNNSWQPQDDIESCPKYLPHTTEQRSVIFALAPGCRCNRCGTGLDLPAADWFAKTRCAATGCKRTASVATCQIAGHGQGAHVRYALSRPRQSRPHPGRSRIAGHRLPSCLPMETGATDFRGNALGILPYSVK
jgi:hypothetical protein